MNTAKEYIKTLLKLAINNNPEVLKVIRNAKVENGGKGSGNFDHDGRPGEVGGSAPNNEVKSYFNTETGLIELKGDELGSTDDEIKENGLKYFKENYQGKKFDNPELKGILFSRIGLNKLKSNSADIEKIKAIPALKDIIEKGKYQGAENLSHSRTDGIIKFHRINADVSINEHKENMSVLIGEDRDGNRFYNLNNKTYTVENSSRGIRAKGRADEEFSINIITDNQEDFNPDIKNNEVQNNKENTKMALIDELKKLITKVENNKEQEMTEKIENEKVDKRDIIRQIMAIAGKHEDNEDVRTIAKLAEKLAYDKSEAGTADNVCDDEEEEVKNKKVKNEETGKDKDFINRELNKGNLLYKKTGVSNREASIASKVDILPNNIITDIQEDFNPMIMGANISNIIKIIPVVILNLFLKK